MATFVKINDTLYEATIHGKVKDRDWSDRESLAVTLAMTYEKAMTTFVDNMIWSHVYQDAPYINETGETVTPDPIEYDDSDYSVAGPITDNRNGTVTVKMGKLTAEEALAELMEVLSV